MSCRFSKEVFQVIPPVGRKIFSRAALEKTLKEKSMWFYVNIIMPLLPKETKGVLEAGDGVIE